MKEPRKSLKIHVLNFDLKKKKRIKTFRTKTGILFERNKKTHRSNIGQRIYCMHFKT